MKRRFDLDVQIWKFQRYLLWTTVILFTLGVGYPALAADCQLARESASSHENRLNVVQQRQRKVSQLERRIKTLKRKARKKLSTKSFVKRRVRRLRKKLSKKLRQNAEDFRCLQPVSLSRALSEAIRYSLVDAKTNRIIPGYESLQSGDSIYLALLPTEDLTIEATFSDPVGSVRFELDSGVHTQLENQAPYALYGDRKGDYKSKPLPIGKHNLQTIAFDNRSAKGSILLISELEFTLLRNLPTPTPTATATPTSTPSSTPTSDPQDYIKLTLVDSQNDTVVSGFETIENGTVINLTDLGIESINLWAQTSLDIGSAKFDINGGEFVNIENIAPYTLAGDRVDTGDFKDWNPAPGNYQLKIDLFTSANATGAILYSQNFSFTITTDTENPVNTPTPTLTPEPTPDSHTHTDDSSKMAEHMAAMDLVKTTSQTHKAISSGSWFSQATWDNGIPDANARVHIPQGIEILYNGVSETRIKTIRVDGTMTFATYRNNKLYVDTIVVTPPGNFEIGTMDTPMESLYSTQIFFADNGPLDLSWDPKQLSRGLINHGNIQVHGQPKTVHLKVSTNPRKGDEFIELGSAPTGWKSGDTVVIAGTRYIPESGRTEDEERKITGVSGTRVFLDRALDFDHLTPAADLKTSVANFSRNVRFITENHESLPNNQRAHTMIMHVSDADIRYAEFYQLGRTDKSKPIDEFLVSNGGARHGSVQVDSEGNPIPGAATNIRGRYSIHLHRSGLGANADAAIVYGNAVWGSPGWAIVHHESHASINNNAVYDVFGAAYVAEIGNETGEWRNNIAIKIQGEDFRNIKHGAGGNHDVGVQGIGYWFQSRMVENVGNIAAGASAYGHAYFHRGASIGDFGPRLVNSNYMPVPEMARYLDEVPDDVPTIISLADAEVFASRDTLHVVKSAGQPTENGDWWRTDWNNGKQSHGGRTYIDNLLGWNVQTGVKLQYTRHYTFTDVRLIGQNFGGNYPGNVEGEGRSSWGFFFDDFAQDNVVMNADIKGFLLGLDINSGSEAVPTFTYINVSTSNVSTPYVPSESGQSVSSQDLVEGRLNYSYASPFLAIDKCADGVLFDSLGAKDYGVGTSGECVRVRRETVEARLADGYYSLEDGRKVVTYGLVISDRVFDKFEIVYRLVDVSSGFDLSNSAYLGLLN